MWVGYELLVLLGSLIYLPRAIWRKRLPHRGWGMRLGHYPAEVLQQLQGRDSLWVHAVSVGEVLAVQPLVRELAATYPQHPIVLSTVTATGFAVAQQRLGDVAVPVFFPLDLRWCVRRAFQSLRPRLLVLVESELWPMVIRSAHARGIAVVVVNGRMSPRAFRRYRWVKPWMAALLRDVTLLLMQSDDDATRLRALGASPQQVQVVGNLKWEASLRSRPSPQEIQATAERIGLTRHDQVMVAGSTHRGEEVLLLRAVAQLRQVSPSLRCIIAPRHVERVAEVERLIRQHGYAVVRLSQAAAASKWDVGLVDTLGQLPQYYGVADVVIVGGSFIPHGGQNPLEAASLGKPIIFGPFMHNFAQIAQQLLSHEAARQVTDLEHLREALRECLTDRASAQAMGRRAQALAERAHGTCQRTLLAIQNVLS